MNFIIESSSVPIYNRIASSFAKTLMEFGHTTYFIDAAGFKELDFINTINDIPVDYYITTNELNFIQKKSELDDFFLFEKIKAKIIFIHHDNLFSAFDSINFISIKLSALANIGQRSYHFCLEESNVDLLKTAGIPNASKINHASEFIASPLINKSQWAVSFVGHLMSSLRLYPMDSISAGQHLQVIAWKRFSESSHAAQPDIQKLLCNSYIKESLGQDAKNNHLATQQFLIACLNKLSSPLRGQLISTIKNHRVDIFGGDLSYGRINDPLLVLQQDNIHYQSATINYQDACGIYQSSRINLNISSLQFDTAINNRVIDVIMSGGFLLTDKREDLEKACSLANEISFESPEEMNFKIQFYSDENNNKIYNEIKHEVFKEINTKFSYPLTIDKILKSLNHE